MLSPIKAVFTDIFLNPLDALALQVSTSNPQNCPDYKKLAEAMGHGVTPKVVTHRIARVRGMSAGGAGDDENVSASPDKKASTPKKAKREKGAATPKGRKGGKKRAFEDDDDSDGDDDGAGEGSPKSAKKAKLNN